MKRAVKPCFILVIVLSCASYMVILFDSRNYGIQNTVKVKPSISIVISHCKESIRWIDNFLTSYCDLYHVKFIIYQKCDDLIPNRNISVYYDSCEVEEIILPNVGRESHTFVHHLLRSNFSDINIFFQGHKHASDYNIIKKINKLLDLYTAGVEGPKWTPFNFQYCPFNHNWLDETDQEDKYCYWFSRVTNTSGSLQRCINSVASYKGEFIANQEALLNVVKDHKPVLLDMMNKLSLEDKPLEIYHIERLWYPFFWPYL